MPPPLPRAGMVPERVRDGISSSQRLLNRPIIKLIPPHFSSSTLVLISPPKRTQIVAKSERARGLESSGCKDIPGAGAGELAVHARMRASVLLFNRVSAYPLIRRPRITPSLVSLCDRWSAMARSRTCSGVHARGGQPRFCICIPDARGARTPPRQEASNV